MWTADRWKEFSVLSTSFGEKIEKWGDYILRRPDPQVIWNTGKKAKVWKNVNATYHRSSKGGGDWEFFDLPKEWTISYELSIGKKLNFRLKPFKFKHTGLFPEQAVNWDWMSDLIYKEKEKNPDKEIKVLNLFSYTGGATLSCAMAGAFVTHVDASKGMVTWARENADISELSNAKIRWIVDDCTKFVEREIRRKNKYDAIIMDPPSYGRGPKGEIWKIEDSIYDLLVKTSKILKDEPLFFLLNSYTTGLQPSVMSYMLKTILNDKKGIFSEDEIGLIVKENGFILPEGASSRYVGKRAIK